MSYEEGILVCEHILTQRTLHGLAHGGHAECR